MISFYGGPNGVQGEQGIQGENGASFTITDLKIDYSFTEGDKNKYNSKEGTWLGIYSTANKNFNIVQYQNDKEEVQSFLLGTLSQPLWYKIQNNNLVASDENIYLTRDSSNNLVEGQLDFTIDSDSNRLKISTKLAGNIEKIYESPVPYKFDNKNGYFTSDDIKQDQIGDIKLRALKDDGTLTSNGEWVETGKPVEIKREESAPFFDILDYTNSEIVDAEVYSAVSQNDFNKALEEFKNFGLEQAYTKFLNSPVGYNHINNNFCGFFELAENSLMIFLYYDKNFEIQYITPFYRVDNEKAYDFWAGEISLEEKHVLGFSASWESFKYSFFSNPKDVTEITLGDDNYSSSGSFKCYFKKDYLIIYYNAHYDYKYLKKITLSTGQMIEYLYNKSYVNIGFIGESLIIISYTNSNKEDITKVIDLTTDEEIASSNFKLSNSIIGFIYQNKNYFIHYDAWNSVYVDKLYEVGSTINILASLSAGMESSKCKRGITSVINNEYLVIGGHYIQLSSLILLEETKFQPLALNFYNGEAQNYFIGNSLFYSLNNNKLRNFEDDFYPTMQKALYTHKKVSKAEFEYLKIK